jgi:hypothetical protein
MTFPLVNNSPPLAIQFNARALAQGQLDYARSQESARRR